MNIERPIYNFECKRLRNECMYFKYNMIFMFILMLILNCQIDKDNSVADKMSIE